MTAAKCQNEIRYMKKKSWPTDQLSLFVLGTGIEPILQD